jgi:predicted metal-binding membrane protein
MGRAAHWPDIWLVVLGSIILLAWWLLARDSGGSMVSPFCSSDTLWAAPLSVRLDLALMLVSPAQLASGSALMIAAMMLPLIIAPLRHVRDRSFARQRARATILFTAGYGVVWMIVAVVLQLIAIAARWAIPAPLLCFGPAVATSILWQVSPTKQLCLNRCHRRPHLAAFGAAADRDAFDFGLTNGASCAGSCWALMLLTLLISQGQILGMIAVTLFVFAERLESPARLKWRWRGPGRALRIAVAQVRMRLTTARATEDVVTPVDDSVFGRTLWRIVI